MTDFSLLGNDSEKSIRTCKILLTILGPKFETLLEGSQIQLDYPFLVVTTLNDFALTGRLKFDESNIEPLLSAAKEYNILEIKKFGSLFLLSNMNAKNIHRIYQLSEEFLCSHDIQQVEKYILSKIKDLAQHTEFLCNCKAEWMLQWLKNDELNAPEETIFLILLSWAQIDAKNAEAFRDLVKHIRFHLIESEFFCKYVKPCTLLKDQSFLEQAQKSLGSISCADHHFEPKSFRLPFELVFSVGGINSHALPTLEVFDIRSKKWFRLKECLPPLAYHGVVLYDNELMTFGGFGGLEIAFHLQTFMDDTFTFNLLEKAWMKKSAMETPKCFLSVAKLGSNIYCMGGYNGNNWLSSVEKYNPETNAWLYVEPMQAIRSDACAVTYDGKIFVVGGTNGSETFSSTEVFDPERKKWVLGPRLNIPRSGLMAIILDDKLYAIGGCNGGEILRTVEILDLLVPNATWTVSNSQLITPRSHFGATVVDKNILVAGGYNGTEETAESEIFCPKTNTWSATTPMMEEKKGLTLVTVEDLPNRKQYLPHWSSKEKSKKS
jgi:N-acetylneuraminic acid mutarotase